MKTKLLTLAMISAFALSACGGGDDSPKVNQSTKPSNQQGQNQQGQNQQWQNQKGQNNQGQQTSDTPYTMEQQVSEWKINLVGDTATFTDKQTRAGDDGANFDHITVNGKEMKLSQYKNGSTPRVGRIDGTDGTAYARYGLIVSESAMGVVAFFQGQPTEINDMPTANGVKYVGQAFAFNPTQATNVSTGGEVNGTSTFTVNFADKTMSGDLTNWKGSTNFVNPGNIHIEAKIKGNSFSTKDATGTTANVKAEGKFYGPQAANLAGAFSNTQTGVQGTFGANKQ